MSDDDSDRTEAELEKTRRVVREQILAQSAANEPDDVDADEDLSKLTKAELAERAEAAGIDTSGMTKADLVEALEGGDR